MPIIARSHVTTDSHSYDTGRRTGETLLADFDGRPKLALVYLTVNHRAEDYLRGISQTLGDDVPLLGCSAQGVMGRGAVHEEGFGASAMLLGGEGLLPAVARVAHIQDRTFDKGRSLGEQLRARLTRPPRFVVLNYDPLSGVDMAPFLDGLATQIECPVVGGGASHSHTFDVPGNAFVYFGREVSKAGAVAFAASGDFCVETQVCHGCAPVGVEMTVTRSRGSLLLELDGRSARDTWAETCGPGFGSADQTTALAIGVPASGTSREYLVRAAYSLDEESGGVALGTHIPEGTRIMLHHRTVEDVLSGAQNMGRSLCARLAGKKVRAVLGFECGARTRPFLGDQATQDENLALQGQLGPADAWIGMMPWGELYPVASRPAFHNYSYPLLAIAE